MQRKKENEHINLLQLAKSIPRILQSIKETLLEPVLVTLVKEKLQLRNLQSEKLLPLKSLFAKLQCMN